MVSFKTFIASSAAIIAAFATVEAAISPSFPQPGTVETVGTAFDIEWTYDNNDTSVTYQIDFMTGSNDNQTVLANVAKKVKGSALKYSWTPPAVTPNSAIYFFMFTGSDDSYYWTTRFGIITSGGSLSTEPEQTQPDGEAIPWGNGELATTTTVTTAAVASSAAASSSAIALSTAVASSSVIASSAAASTSAAATSAAQVVQADTTSAGSVLKPVLTVVSAGVAAYFAL